MLFLSYSPLWTLDDYDLVMNEKLRPRSLSPSIPDSAPETIVDGGREGTRRIVASDIWSLALVPDTGYLRPPQFAK